MNEIIDLYALLGRTTLFNDLQSLMHEALFHQDLHERHEAQVALGEPSPLLQFHQLFIHDSQIFTQLSYRETPEEPRVRRLAYVGDVPEKYRTMTPAYHKLELPLYQKHDAPPRHEGRGL